MTPTSQFVTVPNIDSISKLSLTDKSIVFILGTGQVYTHGKYFPNIDTLNVFGGATSTTNGTKGLVPKPTAGQQNYFLSGNSSWKQLSWTNVENKPSTFTPSAHKHPYTDLTGSTTTVNQAIVSNGTTNGWKLYQLGTAAVRDEDYFATSDANVKYVNGVIVEADIPITDKQYLIDVYTYGVQWDTTVADPAITRIGNPILHKSLPVQSSYKGCVAKGKNIQYWLNPNNWNLKENGDAAILDGTDGDVRVHINRFYGKSGQSGTTQWVRISVMKIDDTWTEIPEMLVDAWKSNLDRTNLKTRCLINTSTQYRGAHNNSSYDQYLTTDVFRTYLGKSATNISRTNFRTYAKNNNSELLCYEFYKWIFYWSYVIEYANFNCQLAYNSTLTSEGFHQGGLGNGVTQLWSWKNYNNYCPITPSGYLNEFGNFTGIKAIPGLSFTGNNGSADSYSTQYAVKWRGFENPFGDIGLNLDGIVLLRTTANATSNVYTTTNSDYFDDLTTNKSIAGIEIASDGYIKNFALGTTAEIIPSEVGANSTTYKCDYHWCNASSTESRTLWVGGTAQDGAGAGLGNFNSTHGVGVSSVGGGFITIIRL